MGEQSFGLNAQTLDRIAQEIKDVHDTGVRNMYCCWWRKYF